MNGAPGSPGLSLARSMRAWQSDVELEDGLPNDTDHLGGRFGADNLTLA